MVTDCNFFLVLTIFLVFIVLLGSFTAPMESQSIHRKKIKTIELVGIVTNSIPHKSYRFQIRDNLS